MSRIYKTQPAIYGKARAWLAKCYIEQDWLYDAEDVIRNMQRNSIDWRAVKEWDYTFADYYIHTGELEKAVPYLRKVIKHEMRKKQKAREWYLMGQIQAPWAIIPKRTRRFARSSPRTLPTSWNSRPHRHDGGDGEGKGEADDRQTAPHGCLGQEQGIPRPGILRHGQYLPGTARHHEGHRRLREGQHQGHA